MIKLFIDNNSDFTLEEAKQYGATMISMPYIIDGKETFPYVDWKEYDAHAFCNLLRSGVIPTTSGLSPSIYISYFEPEFKKGNDIFYVHFSSAMTSTFNAMRIALEELKEKYPDRKFYALDTMGITNESYQITKWACEEFVKGTPVEDILEKAKIEINKHACYFFADDLKFFKKSGRVSGLAAFMGNIIGLRPMITIGDDGKMTVCGKAMGRKNALNALVDKVINLGEDLEHHTIYIPHTDAPQLVEELKKLLIEKFGNNITISVIPTGPVTASHSGPNAIGVGFYSKHR